MGHAITFFFGSGADSDFCKELMSGQSFTEALLKDDEKNIKIRKALLGEQSVSLYLLTYNSRKFFLQTIWNHQSDPGTLNCFGKEIIEKCVRAYDPKKGLNDSEKTDITDYCREWYYYVTQHPEKYVGKKCFESKQKDIQDFFWGKGVFFDTLDEKFNSLRFPKDSNKAKRVIYAYTAIFALMLLAVYNLKSESNISTYCDVFNLLNEDYQCKKNEHITYYEMVSEYASAGDVESCHFVTTNYTKLAEKYIGCGIKKNEMIYLHGKLTWFEDLEKLTVYDVTNSYERLYAEGAAQKNMLMPFILIPSGVKPLVCTRQIEQFHKFIEALRASDELCVIGYRFNSEDNHVNAIIGDWLRADRQHRLIYFNWDNDVDFHKLEWASTFSCIHSAEVKGVTVTNEQIVCIPIAENDAEQKLKEYLDIRRKHG